MTKQFSQLTVIYNKENDLWYTKKIRLSEPVSVGMTNMMYEDDKQIVRDSDLVFFVNTYSSHNDILSPRVVAYNIAHNLETSEPIENRALDVVKEALLKNTEYRVQAYKTIAGFTFVHDPMTVEGWRPVTLSKGEKANLLDIVPEALDQIIDSAR